MKVSLLTRAYWTKNRLSILVPWATPLLLSLGIGFFSVPLAFVAFLILSVIARIVVVKRSPFAGLYKEDFKSQLLEIEITLKDGTRLKTEDIRRTRKRLLLFGWSAFALWMLITLVLPPVGLSLVGYAFWLLLSQGLFKSYLIAKDLPLNGFPFFMSNDSRRGLNSGDFFERSRRSSSLTDTMYPFGSYGSTHPASPSNIINR